jgi:hypothetical protein
MIGEWGTTGTSVEKGASWIYFDFFVRTSKVCPTPSPRAFPPMNNFRRPITSPPSSGTTAMTTSTAQH